MRKNRKEEFSVDKFNNENLKFLNFKKNGRLKKVNSEMKIKIMEKQLSLNERHLFELIQDKYKILRKIGEGNFAKIFLAVKRSS